MANFKQDFQQFMGGSTPTKTNFKSQFSQFISTNNSSSVQPKSTVSTPAPSVGQIDITPTQKKIDLKQLAGNVISKVKKVFQKAKPLIIKGLTYSLSPQSNPLLPKLEKKEAKEPKAIKKKVKFPTVEEIFSKENIKKSLKKTVSSTPQVVVFNMAKGFLGEYKASSQRAGGQNFKAIPEAKFESKNKAEAFGVLAHNLLRDITVSKLSGITQATEGAIGSITNTPKYQFVKSVVTDFASKQFMNLMQKIKPLKITLQDLQDVTTGKGTQDQLIRFAQFNKLKDNGMPVKEILEAGKKSQTPFTKTIYNFLDDVIKTVKEVFTSSLTKEEQKLLMSGLKEEQTISPGTYSSQEVIGKVISGGIEKTTEGKQIIKLATEAQKLGQDIIVAAETKISQPLSQPSTIIPKVMNTDELVKLVGKQGFRTPEQISALKKSIKENGITYPVELTINKDGSFEIYDGTHRVQIAKELGIKEVPVKVVENKQKPDRGVVKQAQKTEKPIVGESRGVAIKPKTVSVPRSQLPVGEGKKKISRLEARVKESLYNMPQETIDKLGLPTYKEMNKEENIFKATEYVFNNPEDAMKVISGEIEAPKGILKNSIYIAMEKYAKGDFNLARRLASLESTRLGQELSILTEVDPYSPVKIMGDIIKVRAKAVDKKYAGRSVKEVTNKAVEKGKKAMKAPNNWNEIIKGVIC